MGASAQFVAVATSPEGDLLVAYTPEVAMVSFHADQLPTGEATWISPRSGERTVATRIDAGTVIRFQAPSEGDWVLMVRGAASTK